MADIYLILEGNAADDAVEMLLAALPEDDARQAVVQSRSREAGTGNKAVDPTLMAVLAIVVSLPGAMYASKNLVRRDGREPAVEAKRFIESARRVRSETHVRISVETLDGVRCDIDSLTAEELVEIARR